MDGDDIVRYIWWTRVVVDGSDIVRYIMLDTSSSGWR